MEFFKLQATGNDYILIDELEGERIAEQEKGELAKRMCERRVSVGADGLLFVQSSEKADARFRMFNPDGTEAEMCGNGMRCFVKYLQGNREKKDKYEIETMAGIKEILAGKEGIRVDMGKPSLEPEEIGLASGEKIVDSRIRGEERKLTAVSMGNPHAVIRVKDVETVDVEKEGKRVRENPEFQNGANVTFYQRISGNRLKVRTYERGVEGETLSCGTGASACATAATLLGDCEKGKDVYLETKGGQLTVEIVFQGERPTGAYLTGPAEQVFRGVFG